MRIHYDHQIFSTQRYGGISQYFSRLMEYFICQKCIDVDVGFKFYVSQHLPYVIARDKIEMPKLRGSGRLCSILNDFLYCGVNDCDIVHTTYYNPKYLMNKNDTPMIATIHDMIPEIFTDLFVGHPFEHKRRYVERATRIICVSENTKKNLTEIYGWHRDNIDVIHHGIDLHKSRSSLQSLTLPERYFLYIGRRNGYKNFPVLMEAAKKTLEQGDECFVVCLGGGSFSEQELSSIGNRWAGKILQMSANDFQVRYALQNAIALVMPSLCEGFGIPIIEAMAQECPLIVANASCFPEIAREAAVYFEPADVDELAEGLLRLQHDETLRTKLKVASARIVPEYSIGKMAVGTLESYKKSLEQNSER
jgi:glycosyltransferase involved in cell wall biosynthesis